MLIMNSQAKVIDNTGGISVNCITVLNNKKFGSLGDKIVVSLRKISRSKNGVQRRVSVGKVYRAVIVQTKKERQRRDGSTLKFSQNSVVLLNRQDQPIGTRIKGTIPNELRKSSYLKTLSLGANTI